MHFAAASCRFCAQIAVNSNVAASTGTYIEGMEDADDEPDVVERKWLRPLYEAAPTVVHRCFATNTLHTNELHNEVWFTPA